MLLMRVIIWLGVPVGLFCLAAALTMMLGWSRGGEMCETWLAVVLPYCR